jgi:Family of unknown function (DUF5675)
MDIQITRVILTPSSTIGELSLDGMFFCYTLEDATRPPGVKLPGATSIPYGSYKVIIDHSTRFNKDMPHILNVPGFEGIRIHCGNTDKDTEGCILLGREYTDNAILYSRDAFNAFFDRLKEAGDATLTVVSASPSNL